MKKTISSKIRLGMFVSIGAALFIVGIYFIGEKQQLFRSTFRVSGVFKDVAGLQEGNNVQFSGVNVGTVENIRIVSDTTILVEILIDENARKFMKKDVVASIGSEGLMGNKVLVINPGSGGRKEIQNNDFVATIQPINMDDVMISLKATIDNTSNIASDLSRITGTIKSGKGTLGKLLMDQALAQNIDSSIVSLKLSSAGLKSLVEDAHALVSENLDSTMINLKEGSAGFKTLMEKARKSWLLWGF